MTPHRPSNHFDPSGEDGRTHEPMACPQWAGILVEAVRGNASRGASRMAPAEWTAALEHAASCPFCSERLAAERAVSEELRLLADAESGRLLSPGCEATLLAAFRGERGSEVRARRWIFALSGSLAAAFLILLGAALLVSRDSGSLVRAVLAKLPEIGARRHVSGAAAGSGLEAGLRPGAEATDAANEDEEEVTDFYAFYPGADPASVDAGALVRVRVPSSELEAFGLPVAQGREDEWVNADVLVAEDGSPQAIRFVLSAPRESRD